jgi:hypothetical protein
MLLKHVFLFSSYVVFQIYCTIGIVCNMLSKSEHWSFLSMFTPNQTFTIHSNRMYFNISLLPTMLSQLISSVQYYRKYSYAKLLSLHVLNRARKFLNSQRSIPSKLNTLRGVYNLNPLNFIIFKF